MFKTIEANIKDGQIIGPNAAKLPAAARVRITIIGLSTRKRPAFGTCTSSKVKLLKDAFAPLTDEELMQWGL